MSLRAHFVMDLFEHQHQQLAESEAPLAARMRPRRLDEFVGQDAIIGPGKLLRRAIQADQLSSLIFYGPPGTGKTTLARVIANTTLAKFISINAVLGGVKDIRAAIESARTHRGQYGRRTILFVDEVHRFNKAQQDALLPWVENGTVILIGATTENPFFEVNKALVSRSRVFQLKPLQANDLRVIVQQALEDSERGYGDRTVQVDPDAIDHLVKVANGDARSALNALELAVETTEPNRAGTRHITLSVAEESIQQKAVLYDKEGDAHFDTISAFIKSIRGSDPDAALYWLARMVYAGEDPRYIFRRLVILAGEDVGMADPNAVVVVAGCADAFDRVGMPEGRYPLAQATLYLATAPKSNSVMAFFDALGAVAQAQEDEMPNAMRDAKRDKKGFGHGAGYLYPHAYRDHWVAQQYLPSSLQGQVFYQPSAQGYEAKIQRQVARKREAQLAGLVEQNLEQSMPEALTYGPDVGFSKRQQDRWLQRATGALGTQLGEIRDRTFTLLNPQRHHVVLDLKASTGLLSWEAVRQVPEGGVYSCAHDQKTADALVEQAEMISEIARPTFVPVVDANWLGAIRELNDTLFFDGIVGRNVLMPLENKRGAIEQFAQLMQPKGTVVLAEAVPSRAQRLSALIEHAGVEDALLQKLFAAEAFLFNNLDNSMVNWDTPDLQRMFERCELSCEISVVTFTSEVVITAALLQQWLGEGSQYYSCLLAQGVLPHEIKQLSVHFAQQLTNRSKQWEKSVAFVKAIRR